MTQPVAVNFIAVDADALATLEGRIALFVGDDGGMDVLAKRVNRLTRGAIKRVLDDEGWKDRKEFRRYIKLP